MPWTEWLTPAAWTHFIICGPRLLTGPIYPGKRSDLRDSTQHRCRMLRPDNYRICEWTQKLASTQRAGLEVGGVGYHKAPTVKHYVQYFYYNLFSLFVPWHKWHHINLPFRTYFYLFYCPDLLNIQRLKIAALSATGRIGCALRDSRLQ